jgi:hypothetical protein
MPEADLDTVYTALAQAVHASGGRSELYLAMLSLRLIAQSGNWAVCESAIANTLADLQAHPGAGPMSRPIATPQGD